MATFAAHAPVRSPSLGRHARLRLPTPGRHARVLLLALVCVAGAACDPDPPRPGRAAWREPALVGVPGGRLDAVSGNLLLRRSDLEIDTRLGRYVLGAVWNSAERRFRFSFEQSYRGGVLVDETGARFDTAGLADGAPLPGTHWTRLDDRRVKTRGGLVHAFDAEGRLEAIHFQGHAHPRLAFRSADLAGGRRITAIEQCLAADDCRPLVDLHWNASGRLAGASDRAGRSVSYAWAGPGRLAWARGTLAHERGGPGVQYAYAGPSGDLVGVVWPDGERAAYRYDRAGRLLEARALGEGDLVFRVSYARAAGARETRLELPGGARMTFRADAQGRLVERSGPVPGEVLRLAWEGLRVVYEQGPDGVPTAYGIQEDEVVRVQRAGLPPRVVVLAGPEAIDPATPWRRPVREVHDGEGALLLRSYGADGLPASQTDGSGETTRFVWDGVTLVQRTGPDGRSALFAGHGEHGHPERVIAGGVETRLRFDAVGNRLSWHGPAHSRAPGGEVARAYDAGRNLVAIEVAATPALQPAAATQRVEIERRFDGRVRALRRPGGGEVTWHYDALGRLVETRTLRLGSFRSELRAYDVTGCPVRVLRPNGTETLRACDAAGRVVVVSHWRDGALEQAASLAWSGGRLESVTDSTLGGTERYERDAAGRVARVVYAGGEERLLGWDARSRPVREAYRLETGENLVSLERSYDGADRLLALHRDGQPLLSFEREGGRWARITSGALQRTLHVDPDTGLPSGEDVVDDAGRLVARLRVAVVREAVPGSTRVESQAQSFRGVVAESFERHRIYGSVLDPAAAGGQAPVGPRVLSFDAAEAPPDFHLHDAVSNWEGNAFDTSASYDDGRALLLSLQGASGVVSTHWDAAGLAVAHAGEAIAWDAAGRLQAVGSRAGFVWDVQGRPVERSDAAGTTRLRFGGRVACDAAGVPTALDLGHVVLGFSGAGDRHRIFDFRGNVKLVADASGSVRGHLRYGSFGVDRAWGEPTRRSFAGGIPIRPGGAAGASLVLLGHRPLDARTGRFLAPDPVPQWVNAYAYAQGNPIFYWDPTGRSFEAVFSEYGGVAGSAAGAALGAGAAMAYLNVGALSPLGASAAAGGAMLGYWAGSHAGGFAGRALDRALGELEAGDADTAPEAQAGPGAGPGVAPPPGRSEMGRAKGCVGACVGPARFHAPGISFGELSSVSAPACAGPRFGEAPDLRGWLPLLLPSCLVLTALAAHTRVRRGGQPLAARAPGRSVRGRSAGSRR